MKWLVVREGKPMQTEDTGRSAYKGVKEHHGGCRWAGRAPAATATASGMQFYTIKPRVLCLVFQLALLVRARFPSVEEVHNAALQEGMYAAGVAVEGTVS